MKAENGQEYKEGKSNRVVISTFNGETTMENNKGNQYERSIQEIQVTMQFPKDTISSELDIKEIKHLLVNVFMEKVGKDILKKIS